MSIQVSESQIGIQDAVMEKLGTECEYMKLASLFSKMTFLKIVSSDSQDDGSESQNVDSGISYIFADIQMYFICIHTFDNTKNQLWKNKVYIVLFIHQLYFHVNFY